MASEAVRVADASGPVTEGDTLCSVQRLVPGKEKTLKICQNTYIYLGFGTQHSDLLCTAGESSYAPYVEEMNDLPNNSKLWHNIYICIYNNPFRIEEARMVRVWFGDRAKAIYNTSVFFKNRYKDEWITDPFARKVIQDVDHSEVIDANYIESPVLGKISPLQLSGGVKALILMKNYPGLIFNASNCGDNCAKWILELGRSQNFTINLLHVMNFGNEPFEIRVLNDPKLVVHNMQEFLDAGVYYLQGEMK